MPHLRALCRHDFTVVETIDFYADEDAELPPPMSQRDIVQLNRAALEPEEEEPDAADGKVWTLAAVTGPHVTPVLFFGGEGVTEVAMLTAHSN
jgi:hypothetical protein